MPHAVDARRSCPPSDAAEGEIAPCPGSVDAGIACAVSRLACTPRWAGASVAGQSAAPPFIDVTSQYRSRLRARQRRGRWTAAARGDRSRRSALRLRQRRRSRSLRRPGLVAVGPGPAPRTADSRSRLFRNDLGRERQMAAAPLHRRDRAQRHRRLRLRHGCGDRRLRQRRLDRSLRHVPRAQSAVPQQRRRHVHRRHRKIRHRRSALEHQRDLLRLRPRRLARSVRRQLRGLPAGHEARLLLGRLGPRLLQSRRLRPGARQAVPQQPQRHLFGRVGARSASLASPGAGSACWRRTSTTTAGPISTSPTTAIRISCGSTSAARARSRTMRCWRVWQ